MSCKVSIIIPVYNSEKYLKEMAESLHNQTLKEMEFIFVDNASTDKSLDILYDIEKKDPERVLIIKLDSNEGPGGGRNVGLQYASGEYIGFVDSDDLVDKEMYECLYDKAVSGDYDIVESGYFSERKNRNMMLWSEDLEGDVTFENRVKIISSCGLICTKIFKKSLIVDSGIDFMRKIPLEDVEFLIRLYLRISKVGLVNKPFYYYRDNPNSISNKRNGQGYFDICNTFSKKYMEHMRREELYSIFKPVVDCVVIGVWFDIFKGYVVNNKNVKKNSIPEIQKQLEKYVPDYKENIFFIEKAKKDKIKKMFISVN